jgi:hypothetical protein
MRGDEHVRKSSWESFWGCWRDFSTRDISCFDRVSLYNCPTLSLRHSASALRYDEQGWFVAIAAPAYRHRERRENELLVLPEDPYLKKNSEDSKLFTSLQIEAFQLAKDLRVFIDGFDQEPKVDQRTMGKNEVYEVIFDQRIPWSKKLNSSYRLRYAPRVENLVHQFGELGKFNYLVSRIDVSTVMTMQEIKLLEAGIISLAHSVDGVTLKVTQ